eukprot:7783102-Pyramimonas_sp.AAC.1
MQRPDVCQCGVPGSPAPFPGAGSPWKSLEVLEVPGSPDPKSFFAVPRPGEGPLRPKMARGIGNG